MTENPWVSVTDGKAGGQMARLSGMDDFRAKVKDAFLSVQDHICAFVAREDGCAFREDAWDFQKGGGGGRARVWEGQGSLLEKGGVNFSAIEGLALPTSAATAFQLPPDSPYFATGVSLVLHPRNPHVPTIHLNIRYFEAGALRWFGGGVDLTPYYPVRSDCIAFHRSLRDLCVRHDRNYQALKEECDRYFLIRHRREARGVGGVFFDHLQGDMESDFAFTTALGRAFPDLYAPVLRHRDVSYAERERRFQGHRRARYAEFNLVYDRGTLFGLQSGGRIESILMSMPPEARWIYDFRSEPDSPEAELEAYLATPVDWADQAA